MGKKDLKKANKALIQANQILMQTNRHELAELANPTITTINQISGANPTMGMQFFANVEILKQEFVAVVEKSGETQKCLIAPKEIAEVKKVKMKDMLSELTSKFNVDEKKISSQIKDVLGASKAANFENIEVALKTIFLYWESTGDTTNTTEYAFAIDMYLNDFGDLGPVKIKTLSFAIWNTDRQAVINSMQLTTIEEYLKKLAK